MHSTEIGVAPPGHRIAPTIRLGRVSLQVSDLARSVTFYQNVLGFREIERSGGRSLLGPHGDDTVVIELVEHRGARPVPRRGLLGLFHFAILLPDRASLGAFLSHLGELGMPVGMSDHLVSEAVYLNDPDGLGIEVYSDRPRESWERSGHEIRMTTEHMNVESVLRAADGQTWTGMPPSTRIGHVHLHVGDLDRAAHYYHEVLGFDKTVWTYPGALFLSAGGYHHHVGLNTWAGNAPAAGSNDARLLHWTIVTARERDIEATATSLEASGIDVTRSDAGVEAADPWGTVVHLSTAD